MEKEGIEKRSTICYINRYYNLGMGWNDNQEIQSFQGIEERKFQGQYELILNMLAEATTSKILKEKGPPTFNESKIIA